jgi:tetratricopeptide (TPR) repeat protein
MNKLVIGLLLICGIQISYAQSVEVKVITNKKESDAILRKAKEEIRINRLYYAEQDKCRNLIKLRSFVEAEKSCKLAITLVDKMGQDQTLSKSSSRVALAVVMLWQKRSSEAISLLTKSLEIAESILDDTDAETGESYFLIGQAYHQLDNVDQASKFYTKAENTYRTAFREMGDSEIREFYPRPIVNILEAHLLLVKNAGLSEETAEIEKRLAETKIEFSEFLRL